MQDPPSPTLAVVVPVYNEEANIEGVYMEWSQALRTLSTDYRFVFVDDGSNDRTRSILTTLSNTDSAHVLQIEQPNAGHGRACRRGYEEALALGAAWILQIDSDGQCDPMYLSQYWSERKDADCVFGHRSTRDDGVVRLMVSKLCSGLVGLARHRNLGDVNVPYRLMRADALERALNRIPHDVELQNIALAFAFGSMPNLRWKRIPIHFRARRAGENSINLAKIVHMGLRLLADLRKVRS